MPAFCATDDHCMCYHVLRYRYLQDFDRGMQLMDEKFNFMTQGPGYVSRKNEGDKLIVFDRGGLLWIFNFHPTKVDTPMLLVLNPA